MQVHYEYKGIPTFSRPVVTIGSFDGIHVGHRKILQQLVQAAKERQTESLLITFEPHPRSILFPQETPVPLLQTLEEKMRVLASLGLDHVVVVPFTTAFANLSAESYVRDFLVGHFHPELLIIGYDHHFGKNREGNLQTLLDLQQSYQFEVLEISAEEINQIAVSSSKIRTALLQGDITTANHYLCSPYSLTGVVVRGQQLGRQLGFPTANVSVNHPHKLIPAIGVYVVEVILQQTRCKGMLGISRRQTLGDHLQTTIEAHLFDFEEDIYDAAIELVFHAWLRADEKFNSLDALVEALQQDKKRSLDYFKKL